jgi:hypothetical protein
MPKIYDFHNTPGNGYNGKCLHCDAQLLNAPDDHCPECIYVEGVWEPDACTCDYANADREYVKRLNEEAKRLTAGI